MGLGVKELILHIASCMNFLGTCKALLYFPFATLHYGFCARQKNLRSMKFGIRNLIPSSECLLSILSSQPYYSLFVFKFKQYVIICDILGHNRGETHATNALRLIFLSNWYNTLFARMAGNVSGNFWRVPILLSTSVAAIPAAFFPVALLLLSTLSIGCFCSRGT